MYCVAFQAGFFFIFQIQQQFQSFNGGSFSNLELYLQKNYQKFQVCHNQQKYYLRILLKNVSFAFLIKKLSSYVVICVSTQMFQNLFLRRDHFIVLVSVLLMKGDWFTPTYLFFIDSCFLRMRSRVSLNQKRFSKNVFQGIFEKASFEKF